MKCEHEIRCFNCKNCSENNGTGETCVKVYECADTNRGGFECTICDKPLTLEQLKQRDGKPVWVVAKDEDLQDYTGWHLVNVKTRDLVDKRRSVWNLINNGKDFLAYDKEQPQSKRMVTIETADNEGLKIKSKYSKEFKTPTCALIHLFQNTHSLGELNKWLKEPLWEVQP